MIKISCRGLVGVHKNAQRSTLNLNAAFIHHPSFIIASTDNQPSTQNLLVNFLHSYHLLHFHGHHAQRPHISYHGLQHSFRAVFVELANLILATIFWQHAIKVSRLLVLVSLGTTSEGGRYMDVGCIVYHEIEVKKMCGTGRLHWQNCLPRDATHAIPVNAAHRGPRNNLPNKQIIDDARVLLK